MTATAIAIVAGVSAFAQTIVLPPGIGTMSATPIEIPGKGLVSLPIPIPSYGIDTFDPRRLPEYFMALPIPLSRPTGVIGRFEYRVFDDGGVLGNTPFGYARFFSLGDYQKFLRKHPPTR